LKRQNVKMEKQLPLISVQNVSYWYGEGALRKQVLFDISIDIFPGEIVILTRPVRLWEDHSAHIVRACGQ